LVGKPERIRPLLSPRCRWEDNIETNFKEIRREVVKTKKWLASVNRVMKFVFPYHDGKFLSS